jgi:hypothetical protein
MMLVPVVGTAYWTYGAIKTKNLEHDVTALEIRLGLNAIDHKLPYWEAPLVMRFGSHERNVKERMRSMQPVFPHSSTDEPISKDPWRMKDYSPYKENYTFTQQAPDYVGGIL